MSNIGYKKTNDGKLQNSKNPRGDLICNGRWEAFEDYEFIVKLKRGGDLIDPELAQFGPDEFRIAADGHLNGGLLKKGVARTAMHQLLVKGISFLPCRRREHSE